METTEKVKSFIKQTIATFKGETDKAVAERNFRKATAALEGQIAALKSKEVEVEEEMNTAKESLNKALYPSDAIDKAQEYINSIRSSQETVNQKEKELKDVQESAKFYKQLLEDFNKEE